MQIVIDIDEKVSIKICEIYATGDDIPIDIQSKIIEAIVDGTVLPEEHGRLIDADKLQKDNYLEKRYGHDFYSEFQSRVKRQLTIIEAREDGEE